MPRKITTPLAAFCAATVFAGCGSGAALQPVAVTPVQPVVATAPEPQPPSQPDPVDLLLAEADRRFADGQQELSLGHLERAKAAFDGALDVLLESPGGARSDARVREHFDRLVDRISALEQAALATGDGFTETRTEPASIDALLAGTFDTTPPTAQTTEAVAADLESTTHDIPIPVNAKVLRYVEAFQGRLRDFLSEGLSRGAQYLPMIQTVFRAEGLPLDLAYVPLIESAFKPTALSRAKARGVWQFMRGTALENGLQADWYIDERADPQKATVAAAKYLKTLYEMFGDWHLAMASYNGGPGRIQRAMKRSRKDDFWAMTTSTTRFLPRETREYVPMILAAIIIAKNPAQYGFDVVPVTPTTVEPVLVPQAVDLRRIAEWAGVPVDEIQRLNPELRRWMTPIREGEYTVKVPAGTAVRVEEGLAASAETERNALQWHTVKKGETLATIARTLRVNRTDLAEANYLKATARVAVGQKLVVPRMPSAAVLAASAAGAPVDAAVALASSAAVESPEPVIHRVRAGDTLYALARRYGTTVDQLKAWNRISGSRLSIGDRLMVSPPKTANAQQ